MPLGSRAVGDDERSFRPATARDVACNLQDLRLANQSRGTTAFGDGRLVGIPAGTPMADDWFHPTCAGRSCRCVLLATSG